MEERAREKEIFSKTDADETERGGERNRER